ncbi:MAG: adenylosuccinate lyase [Chloroflexota bacterium]|nr:adenylosuccinate lyase [Chloroflexota bacterium]MDE2951526.1 adenylosuccinate lyase [Chloroflexota bacterium]
MSLRAISPIDGRYADKTEALRPYLSEWALMKYRVLVEVRWLIAMSEHEGISHVRAFSGAETRLLERLAANFDDEAASEIKSIEAFISHDVKAVEYFIQSRLRDTSLADVSESVHFACTSADINNLAYAMMLRDAMREVWLPKARDLVQLLDDWALKSADASMLARTHGKAASPTTVGKELKVFAARLSRQLQQIESQSFLGKLNGAVGAYNAHVAAYPEVNWLDFSRRFVEELGLSHNPLTTQIEAHDFLAELSHALIRFNTVLLDLCRDMWTYISLGYFKQKLVAEEVGSSTMPHKVNPIDFENAEANLGMSSATLGHLALKLPVSRLQRDLSDTSALRNFGAAIAHSLLALTSTDQGLSKVDIDRKALQDDLDNAWEVLGEAIQTVLRKHQAPGAYEQLKKMTRGKSMSQTSIREFIKTLDIPTPDKIRLLDLTPAAYIGLAVELARYDSQAGREEESVSSLADLGDL